METKDNKMLYVLLGILVVLVIVGGYLFTRNSKTEPVVQTQNADGQTTSQKTDLDPEALITLSLIDSLKNNADLFLDETFLELTDITTKIISETKGRKNPFAPI